MNELFSYRDKTLYVHYTVDPSPDPDQFTIHAHEWLEILYCISGSGSYLVEGVQYPLESGDIFLIRPGEMHRIQLNSEVPYKRIAVHFSAELLKEFNFDTSLLRPFTERALGQYNRYSLEDSGMLLRMPFAEFSSKDIPSTRLNLVSRLFLFLTHLEGQYLKISSSLPVQDIQNQIVAYVNEHLFENLSIQTVADAFYRSRSQINRIFMQATGTSLWKYVSIKRLLAAREMIKRGESANAACSACGFTDYSSFYRAYRSHFGHSPKEDSK